MDIMQRNGGYPVPPGASEILGVEFSGIVSELGVGCGKRWKIGDEVIGLASGVCGYLLRSGRHGMMSVTRTDAPYLAGRICRIHSLALCQLDAQTSPSQLGGGGEYP